MSPLAIIITVSLATLVGFIAGYVTGRGDQTRP